MLSAEGCVASGQGGHERVLPPGQPGADGWHSRQNPSKRDLTRRDPSLSEGRERLEAVDGSGDLTAGPFLRCIHAMRFCLLFPLGCRWSAWQC